jgi:hypothetical protein
MNERIPNLRIMYYVIIANYRSPAGGLLRWPKGKGVRIGTDRAFLFHFPTLNNRTELRCALSPAPHWMRFRICCIAEYSRCYGDKPSMVQRLQRLRYIEPTHPLCQPNPSNLHATLYPTYGRLICPRGVR